MKKLLFLVIAMLLVGAVLFVGSRIGNYKSQDKENTTAISPEASESPKIEDLTATFEIYTNGTKRIFTQSMYHNQSTDVFIENPDPSVIHVKKAGVTWAGFFETLPFSLTKECLITGTKQEFCNSESKKLEFTLNGQNTPYALELEIQEDDQLVVTYGK